MREPTEAGGAAGGRPAPSRPAGLAAELAALGETPGTAATLLQFSSAFCLPCRVTRRLLAGVAEIVPGVRHIEVDAEANLELVRRLGVESTPTVLLLDGDAVEVRRIAGAPPSRAAVLATLAAVLDERPADRRPAE